MNVRDQRSVAEQVRSGFRIVGWILLTLTVAALTLRSEMALLDRNAANLHRLAGGIGLALAAILMFVSVDRWAKWFVGALAYWILKAAFTLPFHPTAMLLQYLFLFSTAFALCAWYAVGHGHRPILERFGMVAVVVALTFSLSFDFPLALLIGIVALALSQIISRILRATDNRVKLSELR